MLSAALNAQILRQQTSPQAIGSQIPGFSQVSSINTVNISYTPATPISYPTPVDGDTTTENPDIYDYGSILPINYSLSDGNFTTTSLGNIWTLRINIPNALSIGLTFTQFNLSPSAEMYIYNDAQTVLNYQIKKEHFVNSDIVSISSINGNAITIYLIEPGNFGTFQSTLTIGEVIAGYQPIEDVGDVGNNSARYGTGCMPDIRCYPQYMTSARAVGRFASNGFGGTGTLINNENNDGRAYFLTAFHVLDVNRNWLGRPAGNGVLDPDEIAALRRATFQFQFWRTQCNSQVNTTGIQFSGAIVRAANHASDMVLLELINPPGIGDGVNYAGWSRQTSASSNSGSYIIHHPEGKNMRFTQTRDVGSYLNANFWYASYSSGAVAEGSSGSALFSETGQIIGQLKGGWSSCLTPRWNDRYGKFYRSWNDGGLQQWLSPVQGLQSTGTLNLTDITFTGPSQISSCTSPTGQYSTIPGLLDVTYTWTVSSGLQISSGQGTPNVTISALQGQDRTETITLTLASPTKGRTKTFTISRNISIFSGAPTTTCSEIANGSCYRQVFLCPSQLNTWQYVGIPGTWGSTGTGFHIEAQGGTYFNGGATSMNITTNSFSVWAPSLGAYNSSSVTVSAMNDCGVSPYQPYVIAFIEKDPYQCGYYYYSIAPNPAKSTISVSLNQSNTDAVHTSFDQISIYDQQGNLKLTRKLGKVKTSSINVSNLATGMYIVEISDGTYKERQQLIVQK